jgi:hypothetical protein
MAANDRSGRRSAVAALTVLVCLVAPFGGLAVGAAPPDTSATVAVSDTTIASTPPVSPSPATTPETTEPDTTTPTPSVVGGAPDDDDAHALTWFAIIAAIALLGIAAWWMLRRDDGLGVQRMDDDWPSDSSVI